MLKAIRDRYGEATDRMLLSETIFSGKVTWSGRGIYETELSIFVGPDAARWAWCAPPPGPLNLPGDLRVEGTQVEGRTANGTVFLPVECAPSALSHAPDTGSRVLMLIEAPEFTLIHKAREAAPARVEWTLLNAVFDGIDWSPDPAGGTHAQRIDKFAFANGARRWTLKYLQAHRDSGKANLSNGLVQRLPTATLTTTLDHLATPRRRR